MNYDREKDKDWWWFASKNWQNLMIYFFSYVFLCFLYQWTVIPIVYLYHWEIEIHYYIIMKQDYLHLDGFIIYHECNRFSWDFNLFITTKKIQKCVNPRWYCPTAGSEAGTVCMIVTMLPMPTWLRYSHVKIV